MYYKTPYANYKRDAALFVSSAERITGPVQVYVTFYMPIPKSTPKKDAAWMDGAPHFKKPDIDNLLKAALDLLSGKVFDDDSYVARQSAEKVYTSGDPCTVISVEPFDV